MSKAQTKGPWVVDHVYPAAKWSILNLATRQRKVIGPAGNRRINYYDVAVREAERRNEKLRSEKP